MNELEFLNLPEGRKVQLKGMTRKELKTYFHSIGEQAFRGEQVFNWLYNHMVLSYDEMGNVPKTLRGKLTELTSIVSLELAEKRVSEETGTVKFIFKTEDGQFIETVIIPEEERVTLCLSSQIGCPLDCKFCATGLMGFKRNLTSGEIFDQYMLGQKNFDRPITNIVYMGMGEPLINFRETARSLLIFSEEITKRIPISKVTVSTAGIPLKIIKLAEIGMKSKLAFSLHSCFEDVRSKLMPINEKYPLELNLEALSYYFQKLKSRITFEYIMLKDINDRDEDVEALIQLNRRIPSKLNIIPFNSLRHMNPAGISSELEPSSFYRIDQIVRQLRDEGVTVMVRNTFGEDIQAACGQLASQYANP